MPVDAILSVEPGAEVKAGDVLARIPMSWAQAPATSPAVCRAWRSCSRRAGPKDHAIIAEISGTVEFGKDYKNKQRITIKPDEDDAEPVEYLIPRGKSLAVQHGDRVEKGDFVFDGNPAPHDILAIKGVEELADYLVNEIQDVYRLQGVTINDKHIEVIVRQMLQKVEIRDPGDTDLIKGEQIDRIEFDENERRHREGGQEARHGEPGPARHHQGVAADALVHLGRLLPGDDAGADRGRRQRQGRHARGPQGERDRRPPDPGRHRRQRCGRLRKVAAKRDELIAREQAKVDAEKALAGPSAAPIAAAAAPPRRRSSRACLGQLRMRPPSRPGGRGSRRFGRRPAPAAFGEAEVASGRGLAKNNHHAPCRVLTGFGALYIALALSR